MTPAAANLFVRSYCHSSHTCTILYMYCLHGPIMRLSTRTGTGYEKPVMVHGDSLPHHSLSIIASGDSHLRCRFRSSELSRSYPAAAAASMLGCCCPDFSLYMNVLDAHHRQEEHCCWARTLEKRRITDQYEPANLALWMMPERRKRFEMVS